jgi:hypothetical protein
LHARTNSVQNEGQCQRRMWPGVKERAKANEEETLVGVVVVGDEQGAQVYCGYGCDQGEEQVVGRME